VYGALDDYHKLLQEDDHRGASCATNGLHGEELLGFGDGFVEIEEVRRAGGVAVAVASDEVRRQGVKRLESATGWWRAGADVVIPDYRRPERIVRFLFAED